MNNLFLIFLSLSLSASVLIGFLFFCKPFIKDKLSRQWQYYIWLIVITRLLFPFALDGSILDKTFETIGNAYYGEEIQTYENNADSTLLPLDNIGEKSFDNFLTEEIPDAHPLQEAFWLLVENIWLVWLNIALTLFIKKVTVYKSFIRYVRAGMEPVSNVSLLDQVALIGNKIGVSRSCELCVNPLISSPLLIGFFRPCIVIPSTKISEKSFYYTVVHELTHYRRCDMFYKWLVQITICLHWFNPLVYLMEKEITKECEFSCDEVVITKEGVHHIQDYGNTLLETMVLVGQYKEILVSVTLSENKKILKERIGTVMKYKRKSKTIVCVSLVLTLILLVLATTVGAYTRTNQVTSFPMDNKYIIFNTDKEIAITAEINFGGMEIIQGSLNQIKAEYDALYYDVKLIEENGEWKVTVAGKKSLMGAHYVKLYLPDTRCSIKANVVCGSLLYDFPQDSKNSLQITSENSSLEFSEPNQYKNYDISITAKEQEFMQYGYINYPNYFYKSQDKIFYKSGTGTNEIDIMLTGFTNIDFE